MLRFATLAVVGAISAAGAAQAVVMLSQAHQGPQLRETQAPVSTQVARSESPVPVNAAPAEGGDAALVKSADGHFWADALVDGRRVHLLVDTGASSVFLTPADAERLGLEPAGLLYDHTVRTGGGDSLAASVKLSSVSVDGVQVADVDALVIGRGLPASLLGMSYLGRLSRLEATPTSLLLSR